jgi:hypothetical protein
LGDDACGINHHCHPPAGFPIVIKQKLKRHNGNRPLTHP